MCQSKAEGGRRCAAHTRPRYQAATFGTAEWDAAASDYAATREGEAVLTDALVQAQTRNDIEREIGIETALAAGARQRRASNAAAHEVAQAHRQTLHRRLLPPTHRFDTGVFEPAIVDLPDGTSAATAVQKVYVDELRSDEYYYAVVGRRTLGTHSVENTQHGTSENLSPASTREEVAAQIESVQFMAADRVRVLRSAKGSRQKQRILI